MVLSVKFGLVSRLFLGDPYQFLTHIIHECPSWTIKSFGKFCFFQFFLLFLSRKYFSASYSNKISSLNVVTFKENMTRGQNSLWKKILKGLKYECTYMVFPICLNHSCPVCSTNYSLSKMDPHLSICIIVNEFRQFTALGSIFCKSPRVIHCHNLLNWGTPSRWWSKCKHAHT